MSLIGNTLRRIFGAPDDRGGNWLEAINALQRRIGAHKDTSRIGAGRKPWQRASDATPRRVPFRYYVQHTLGAM